jgi:hypothetical protein
MRKGAIEPADCFFIEQRRVARSEGERMASSSTMRR